MVRQYRDYPEYHKLQAVFAVPNGNKREGAVAQSLSDEGVEPGVPDVLILAYGEDNSFSESEFVEVYGFAAIEFKKPGREKERARMGNVEPFYVGKSEIRPIGLRDSNKMVTTGGFSDYQLGWATIISENSGDYFAAYNWVDAWNYLCDYLDYPALKVNKEAA